MLEQGDLIAEHARWPYLPPIIPCYRSKRRKHISSNIFDSTFYSCHDSSINQNLKANGTENFGLLKTPFPYNLIEKTGKYKIRHLKCAPARHKQPAKIRDFETEIRKTGVITARRKWRCSRRPVGWPLGWKRVCSLCARARPSREKRVERSLTSSVAWLAGRPGSQERHFLFAAVYVICQRVQCNLLQSYFKHW